MKNITLFFFLFISISFFAQNKNSLSQDSLVWYGLDFSQAKFVGDFQGKELKTNLIPSWNLIVVNEPQKYNVGKYFGKKYVFNDLQPVIKNNESVDEKTLTDYKPYQFTNPTEVVTKMVSNYSAGEKKSGLGLVFIVESFDKQKLFATYYITFFDIKTKQVYSIEKTGALPGGFGVRNYWASTILKIMIETEDKRFRTGKE